MTTMTSIDQPLAYTDDVESIPPEEGSDIQRVVEAIKLTLMRSQAKNGEFRADVHVKTHGYAEGEFRVLPNLPKELAQGLFQQAGTYRAIVRFSNCQLPVGLAMNPAKIPILSGSRGD